MNSNCFFKRMTHEFVWLHICFDIIFISSSWAHDRSRDLCDHHRIFLVGNTSLSYLSGPLFLKWSLTFLSAPRCSLTFQKGNHQMATDTSRICSLLCQHTITTRRQTQTTTQTQTIRNTNTDSSKQQSGPHVWHIAANTFGTKLSCTRACLTVFVLFSSKSKRFHVFIEAFACGWCGPPPVRVNSLFVQWITVFEFACGSSSTVFNMFTSQRRPELARGSQRPPEPARAIQSKPEQARANQRQPEQTRGNQTQPEAAKPNQRQPSPTRGSQTQPEANQTRSSR